PEHEAAAVLEAWTAAWHPAVLAAAAGPPDWASVELPWRREGDIVGVVPAGFAEAFAAGAAAPPDPKQQFMQAEESPALAGRLLTALGVVADGSASQHEAWQDEIVQDFFALGLAMLLGQRLARRMRAGAESDLEQAGFSGIVQAAATAWQTADEQATRDRLGEAFGCLEVIRDHFYPVECWCLDLILLSPTTINELPVELSQATPAAVLADPETVSCLKTLPPTIYGQLQQRLSAGTLSVVGSLSAEIPLALSPPERIARELAAVRQDWQDTLGVAPAIYAQQAGPVAPLLPQLLSQSGYSGVLWASFDGRQLPDPAASRFRWQDAANGIDAVRPRLFDGRRAAAVLALPVTLGDAMDHDHTVVLMACHHAGTASPWFDMLRRLASWTNLFGRFCTPETFLEETDHLAETVRFDRDAFPVRMTPLTSLPVREGLEAAEPLATQVSQLVAEAQAVVQTRREAAKALSAAGCSSPAAASSQPQPHQAGWGRGGLSVSRRKTNSRYLRTACRCGSIKAPVALSHFAVGPTGETVCRSNWPFAGLIAQSAMAGRLLRPPIPPWSLTALIGLTEHLSAVVIWLIRRDNISRPLCRGSVWLPTFRRSSSKERLT
ncbi:MAG: hypothetical protein EBU59_04170, partial [Planctomycetia bacterium]|nr:hypothetical protein [Planctomycetia bacterium]